MLGQIEDAGRRLEHAGWVFIETGTSSRNKIMASGQKVSTSDRVEGAYLFRLNGQTPPIASTESIELPANHSDSAPQPPDTPAGWYTASSSTDLLRYWDDQQRTEHTAPRPPAA